MLPPCVVLLTGHPAVGKSTFAPLLARALGAACLSKDQVRFRVFDGWTPVHPRVAGEADLQVGTSRFAEDQVVWGVYFWAVREAVQVAPVVAETAMTRQVNRDDTKAFLATLTVPVVEVLLSAPVERLLQRYKERLASPFSHDVYKTFDPDDAMQLLGVPYQPLLEPTATMTIDATDPARLDARAVASEVDRRVKSLIAK